MNRSQQTQPVPAQARAPRCPSRRPAKRDARRRPARVRAKQRTCLKCGALFDSAGPANRICNPCDSINAAIRVTEDQLRKQRGVKRHNGDVMQPHATCDVLAIWLLEGQPG